MEKKKRRCRPARDEEPSRTLPQFSFITNHRSGRLKRRGGGNRKGARHDEVFRGKRGNEQKGGSKNYQTGIMVMKKTDPVLASQ